MKRNYKHNDHDLKNLAEPRKYLQVLAVFVLLVLSTSCNRHSFKFENVHEGYRQIEQPYNKEILRAFDIAVNEILILQFDTTKLNWTFLENIDNYSVAFFPRLPLDTIYTNKGIKYIIHVDDREVDIFISKSNYEVVRVYNTFEAFK